MIQLEVILLSGKQGAGKTTVARDFQKAIELLDIPGWICVEIPFAQAIYEMHDACRAILRDKGLEPPHTIKDGNLLQLLGTEWGRKTLGEDVWVETTKGEIENTMSMLVATNSQAERLFVVIPDCRFENEFNAFPDATKVRLVCDAKVRKARAAMWRENDKHPSETGLDVYAQADKFDLTYETQVETPESIAKEILRYILRADNARQDATQSRI